MRNTSSLVNNIEIGGEEGAEAQMDCGFNYSGNSSISTPLQRPIASNKHLFSIVSKRQRTDTVRKSGHSTTSCLGNGKHLSNIDNGEGGGDRGAKSDAILRGTPPTSTKSSIKLAHSNTSCGSINYSIYRYRDIPMRR